ncbi:MAG: enoyl-CoA hydratase-related protein, partial [Syntrophomonadaceae bacterium]|nr:enoyl-CoA hydratase-related protein [Syntrophomonadaceae bacterium]
LNPLFNPISRLVGTAKAKEIAMLGEPIGAMEALRIGLVNKIVDEASLMDEAKKMANKIASKGQVAVRLAKEAINEGMEMDLDKAMIHEADLFGLCFTSEDQREGMTAFIEKRPAKFTGK